MAHSQTKMSQEITALNADNAHSPHDIDTLHGDIKQIETNTLVQFTELRESAIKRVSRLLSERLQRDKALHYLVARQKSLCRQETLEMWKLGTEADREIRTKVAKRFPHYKWEPHTISINTDAFDRFFIDKPIHSEAWRPHNKAATVDDFFAQMNAIIQKFKRDYEETKQKLSVIVENIESCYAERSITDQSITVQSYNDDVEHAQIGIGDAEREFLTSNTVKQCLRRSTVDVSHIATCFKDANSVIDKLKVAATLLHKSSNEVVFELSSFQ